MKNTELKHLSRRELLEMLLELNRENEQLRAENGKLRHVLETKQILCDKAGSIAEASLRLNGVFVAAQAAADQYLENIKRLADEAAASAAVQPDEAEASEAEHEADET